MQTIWYLSQIYIYIYTLQYLFPFHFTGAIFTEEQKDGTAELAFKYAVYRINKDKSILPRTTLTYDIQYVPRDDSFRTTKKGKLAREIVFYIYFAPDTVGILPITTPQFSPTFRFRIMLPFLQYIYGLCWLSDIHWMHTFYL